MGTRGGARLHRRHRRPGQQRHDPPRGRARAGRRPRRVRAHGGRSAPRHRRDDDQTDDRPRDRGALAAAARAVQPGRHAPRIASRSPVAAADRAGDRPRPARRRRRRQRGASAFHDHGHPPRHLPPRGRHASRRPVHPALNTLPPTPTTEGEAAMPEYLAPGVFVEETSFRSKSIEGVATSTTGFVGLAHYGPVQFSGGPTATEPRLVTSYVEFERIYGRLDPLAVPRADNEPYVPYLAHAARVFFINGGRRLYIVRIFAAGATDGVAEAALTVTATTTAFWRARWPGRAGNVAITCEAIRSGDVGIHTPGGPPHANIVQDGAVLEVVPVGTAMPTRTTPIDPTRLRVLRIAGDGSQTFERADGTPGPP